MDLETKEMHHLKWARLLIKSRGRKVPNRLISFEAPRGS